MKSIIQKEKQCYVTDRIDHLQEHHIFFGNPGRKLSEKYGLKVWLTMEYHTASNNAVHNNRDFDLALKMIGQKAFEKTHGTREDFMRIFGRNYL